MVRIDAGILRAALATDLSDQQGLALRIMLGALAGLEKVDQLPVITSLVGVVVRDGLLPSSQAWELGPKGDRIRPLTPAELADRAE